MDKNKLLTDKSSTLLDLRQIFVFGKINFYLQYILGELSQFLPWSYRWSVRDSKVQQDQQADRVDDKAGLAVASSSSKSSYSNWQQPLQ